jgi:hypothetical protein
MDNTKELNDFLKSKEFKQHESEFKLNDLRNSINNSLGKAIHTASSFKKGRIKQFNSDYSKLEHANMGNVTVKGAFLASAFSYLSSNNIFGKSDPLIDLSHEHLSKSVSDFKELAHTSLEYQEILTFMSENLFNSPDITATAFQMAIAAGTLATGLYVKNGTKRNYHIENICSDVDKEVKHKNFSLKHSAHIFQTLDNLYEYRRLQALAGAQTKNFIKNITAPLFHGLKNNISNPILNKIVDVFGEDKCKQVTDKLRELTPEMIQTFFQKDKTIQASDMILYIDQKLNSSILMDSTNDPLDFNIQDELSKVSKEVYESMQLTQTRRALILATKEHIQSQQKINILKGESGLVNKFNLRKETSKAESSLETIKLIESLSSSSHKENRISRFMALSNVANKIIKEVNRTEDFTKKESTQRDISRFVNSEINKEEKEITHIYMNQANSHFYSTDIEKMLMPKTYSFEAIFRRKIDEMIENKTIELDQKRQQIQNRIKIK